MYIYVNYVIEIVIDVVNCIVSHRNKNTHYLFRQIMRKQCRYREWLFENLFPLYLSQPQYILTYGELV